MNAELEKIIGPGLAAALAQKGYASLTSVQEAVLDPAIGERDLRITSQTGSGKTVAIGLSLRDLVARGDAKGANGVARPHALVVAPTRELAKQVEEELSWLYAPLGAAVASVTGGASYRDERRALGAGPAIIVGTPGRLLDHLTRGSVDGGGLGAVVLDEADRLLDLGFRDDLEAILAKAPEGHRTHLVSATFPREVRALADKVQRTPFHVEGTPLGAANADIDHVVHLVSPHQRTDAIINLLLGNPEEQTLIFARTRADVARIAGELVDAGFRVSSLSGEMDQPERNRALAAFKRGDLRALVATDVAARGIDVQDIARVIHAEPPTDPDSYTHRSGRTGRAGRKGESSMLVAPVGLSRATSLLARAKVAYRVAPIPTADEIRAAVDGRVVADLTREAQADEAFDARTWTLAKELAASADVTRTLARLLVRTRHAGPTEPRDVRVVHQPTVRGPSLRERGVTPPSRAASRQHPAAAAAPRAEGGLTRSGTHARPDSAKRPESAHAKPAGPREPRAEPYAKTADWVAFRVSWGSEHGADARRLLAMICRRGGIQGNDVGTIRVARTYSLVEVKRSVATAFSAASSAPDERNPRVKIQPTTETAQRPEAPGRPASRGAARATASSPPRRAPRGR